MYVLTTINFNFFNNNIDYNRMARKIAIANLGGPVWESNSQLTWSSKKDCCRMEVEESVLEFFVLIQMVH